MPDPVAPEAFSSVHTSTFPALLRELACSLLVTTFQAGRVIVVRPQAARSTRTASRSRCPRGRTARAPAPGGGSAEMLISRKVRRGGTR
jgi:hypothetical protein